MNSLFRQQSELNNNQTEKKRVNKLGVMWTHIEYHEVQLGWQPPEHLSINQPAYLLLIVTEGKGKMVLEHSSGWLSKGSCVHKAATDRWRIEDISAPLRFFTISYTALPLRLDADGNQLNDQFSDQSSALPFTGKLHISKFASCLSLAEQLYELSMQQDAKALLLANIRFYELLHLLAEEQQMQTAPNGREQLIKQSLDYIGAHYDDSLTVDQLAMMAGVSRWSYTQMFKAATGQLPLDYLNELRINHAKQLLAVTNDKLLNIAEHVGFSSEYYFGRRFKQTVGVSPGQYRRNHQAQEELRVFAPFLEDFIVALGMEPIAQFSHSKWGRQHYLGLNHIAEFRVDDVSPEQLEQLAPSFIILEDGIERWGLEQLAYVAPALKLPEYGENWRGLLLSIGDHLGASAAAEQAILRYEAKAKLAREQLQARMQGQSVALLRISFQRICLYGGEKRGYTGPVLYGDLQLEPHWLVERLVAQERRVEISLDQLQQLEADHLFVTFDEEEGDGRALLHTELWRSLPAVWKGQVYEVDFLSWMNYGVLSHRKKIDDIMRVLGRV